MSGARTTEKIGSRGRRTFLIRFVDWKLFKDKKLSLIMTYKTCRLKAIQEQRTLTDNDLLKKTKFGLGI